VITDKSTTQTASDAPEVVAKSTLQFPFNTTLKLSTLVGLACEVENETGISPRCTVKERRAQLATVAGHCRTKGEAREAIRADLTGATK
jgi:hypothetical protein